MNKRHYKVIFSRVLNQLVVVSELAKSQGKAQSENVSSEQEKTGVFSTALSLNPIHFSLMLALGFVFLVPSVHAEDMAIRADKSAPNNQQPTVLQTANGLPQVNIQTPSAGGVSRNQYSQFDVTEKGAILNNARQATQTQMAGWVQGNPNLAHGEAKVILNEVNSTNPSHLKGYVEVAGQKADVVIANPSGIQCDGCGVINAGRTTLTTGKAEVENGELKGYRVRGGKVTVGQKGMDTSKADYTDIIAEKAEIKGGVWAKQVKVTTGKNNVDRTNDSVVYVGDKNTDNTDRTSDTQSENQSYSVDVSQLGGMYAEKIHLVDNGQGLGVRNAGHIGASAGSVKIDSQGKIVNEGVINGVDNIHLHTAVATNTGKIESKQGQIDLNAKSITQDGSVIARKGNVSLKGDVVRQKGETVAKGRVDYDAKSIVADKTAFIAAGVNITEDKGKVVRTLDDAHAEGSGITLKGHNSVTMHGKQVASGNIAVQGGVLNLDGSQATGYNVSLSSDQRDIQLNQANVYATNGLSLSSSGLLSTQGSELSAETIKTSQSELDNKGGHWTQRGSDDLTIHTNTLNNQDGGISTKGRMFIEANNVNNSKGTLLSGKALQLDTKQLDSADGVIASDENVTLSSQNIVNRNGLIQSGKSAIINTGLLDNQKGKVLSRGEQQISSTTLINQDGNIVSGEKQSIQATQLNNHNGIVSSQTHQKVSVQKDIDNRQGRISGVDSQIRANQIDNSGQGELLSAESLSLNVASMLNNTQGIIKGTKTFIKAEDINNNSGVLYAQNLGQIQVSNQLDNQNNGKVISLGDMTLQAEKLDNRGGVTQVAQQLALTVPTILNNKTGKDGSFIQANKLTIDAKKIDNQGTVDKSNGAIQQGIAAKTLLLNAQDIDNVEGGIYVEDKAKLHINGTLNNQKGEVLSWKDTEISGSNLSIDNDSGRLQASHALDIHTHSLSLTGKGHLEADKLHLGLQSDFHSTNDINAATELNIETSGSVINSNKLSAGKRLTISAQNVDNQEAGRLSSGETRITASGKITNQGLINSFTENNDSKTVLKATHIDNVGSGRIYGDHVALQADKIENHDGKNIAGEVKSATIAARHRLSLTGKEIVNSTDFYEKDKKGGSTLYSGGSIEFGARLNTQDQAEGKADVLRNKSGIIEAEGGIGLSGVKQTFNTNEHFVTEKVEVPEEGKKQNIQYVMIGMNGIDFNTGGQVKSDRFEQRVLSDKNKPGVYDLVWKTLLHRKLDNDELKVGYIPLANQKVCSTVDPSLCYIYPTTLYGTDYGVWKRFGLKAPQNAPSLENLPTIRKEPSKPGKVPMRYSEFPELKARHEEALRQYDIEIEAYKQDVANYNKAIKEYTDWANKHADSFTELNQRIKANNDLLPGHYRERWVMNVTEEKVAKSVVTKSLPGQILAGADIDLGNSYLENDKSTIISGGLIHKAQGELKNLDEKGTVSHQIYGTASWVEPRWRGHSKGWRWYGENFNDVTKRRETNTTFDMNIFTELSQANKAVDNPFYQDQSAHRVKLGNGVESSVLGTLDTRKIDTQAIRKLPTLQTVESQFNNQLEVRTIQPDTRLPTQSLYKINPTAESHVLVETDSDFTNKNRWLSSDYILNSLHINPQATMKRLGDGYYEQRLVREQINRLTGHQFSGNNRTFEEQYKSLMDAGLTFAKKFNLTVGVSLTPEQVAQLTSDIVWIEKQKVTLPSGKVVEALVPRVYAVVKKGDLNGTGTLISGEKLYVKGSEFENQGTLSGRQIAKIDVDSLKNSGTLSSEILSANVSGNANNIGGVLEADKALLLKVAGDFNHRSTTQTSDIKANGLTRHETNLDRKALLHVKGENGLLSVSANNMTLEGSEVSNDGKGLTLLDAKNNLNLTALSVGYDEKLGNSNAYRNANLQDVVASTVKGGGDVQLQAKDIHANGGKLESEKRLALVAENDLVLDAAGKTASLEEYAKTKKRNLISSRSSERYSYDKLNAHEVAQLKGEQIEVTAGRNVSMKGTQANATQTITALAGGELDVGTVTNSHEQIKWNKHKRSGLSASFSHGTAQIGYQRNKSNRDMTGYDENVIGSQLVAENGALVLNAKDNVNVNGSRLASGGDMVLEGKNVNLNAVNEQHNSERHQSQKSTGIGMGFVYDPVARAKENYRQKEAQGGTKSIIGKSTAASDAVVDSAESMMRGLQPYANHNRSESHKYNQKSLAKTTALESGGKLNIQAREGDIRAQGSRINAEGDAQFIAAQNVDFGVAVHEQSQQASSRQRGVGIDGLAKYVVGGHTQRENGDTRLSQEVGSQISIAGNSTTIAEKGDVTLKGTTFVSGGKNRLQANEGNVKLMTAETTDNSLQVRKGHGVGEAVISDTERFFGYNRTRMNQDGTKVSHDGSQLTSLNNKVEVYAGKDYQQTASEVLAKEKVDINAQNITINNALNHQENSYSESDLKIGQFSRIKSPIIDLINTIEGAVKNDKASDRLKAANAMSIAAQGYNLYNSISKLKDPKSGTYLFRAESGSGIAHSRQSQEGLSDISQGSRINAKEINLVARGDGSLNEKGERKLGNINLTHAELTSRDETGKRLEGSRITLTGNELNIKAGENHTQFKGRNSSMGVEVGVAATVGAQTGVGIYARVGGSSGKEDGESKTYQSSQLNAETVTLNSQGDTNIIGSQVKGKTVNANVGGNLNIESLQDEEHFKTKSSGGGLEVEFGFGNNWSVSGYGNSEKGESHRKQVNEQAGIFAEEGGYHVDAKNVHLNGGAITGTNSQANELKTNSFTFANIQNESSSNAMSGSVSANAKGKGSKVNSTSFGGGLPINESDSDNSVTRATLSEGKITLNKDSEPTQTTAQALGINTDINQANSQVNAPKDVKQQLSEQRQISAAAGHIRDAVNTYMANQQKAAIKEMAALQAEREELVKRNDKVALAKVDEKLITLLKESEEWGNEGKYRRALDAITSAGVAALTGQSAQGIAVTAASPYVNQAIKHATTDEQTGKVNKVTNIAAHALWGAVESNALGGSSTAGALSAGGAELVAPQIAKVLYDKAPNELTSSEKQRVIALSGVIGKAIGGITSAAKGGDTYAISKNSDISGNIAKNAVENNSVFKARGEHYLTQLQKLKKKPLEEKNRLLREMGAESTKHSLAIREACKVSAEQCKFYIEMVKDARHYYIEEQTKHPEWTYSEEGKMLRTLQGWAEYDLKMAQGILAEKPQVIVSARGVPAPKEIYDKRNNNRFANYRSVVDIDRNHHITVTGYTSEEKDRDDRKLRPAIQMVSGGTEVAGGVIECFASAGWGCGLGIAAAVKGLDNAATGFTNYGKHPSEQNDTYTVKGLQKLGMSPETARIADSLSDAALGGAAIFSKTIQRSSSGINVAKATNKIGNATNITDLSNRAVADVSVNSVKATNKVGNATDVVQSVNNTQSKANAVRLSNKSGSILANNTKASGTKVNNTVDNVIVASKNVEKSRRTHPGVNLNHNNVDYPSTGMDNYQRGKIGDSDYPEVVYRGTNKRPEDAFDKGFNPRGKGEDIYKHAVDNTSPPSKYVCTSTSCDVAANYATNIMGDGHAYIIRRPENGVDVNKVLGAKSPYPSDKEIAIPGPVPGNQVLGAIPVDKDGNLANYSIPNPNRVRGGGDAAKATEHFKTCSFRGDMEVKTEQGYKPIQSIKVGDKVYAKNEQTGRMSYQRVQAHYNNLYDSTVYVEVMNEQGKQQTIISNKIHPFFTQVSQGELVPSSEGHFYKGEIQNAQWVDAQNLKSGYKLLSENNHWQTVKGVSIKAEKLSAYNLTVENDHTYFIKGTNSDSDGVWVHNECYIGIPKEAKEAGKINGYKAYTFTENGETKTVIQTGERRFETLDQPKALDPTLNGSQTKTIKVDFDETRIKNSEAHKIVNNLDVNTRYELSNGTKFKTNDYGYVEEISFKPIDEKMPRTSQQTAIGYLGEIGDVGGHIQACRYGGTCDRYNLFPQNGNFNNSAYKVYFENIVKKAVDKGKAVDVVIKFERSAPNSPRPDKLRVTIGVEGSKYRYVNVFKNQYGGGK